jgi:HAD superfamily hydrolase (TIGR01450 family)
MTLGETPRITVDALLDRYEAILLDAYGVLLTHEGALPGAAGLIDRLHRGSKPWFILTNDASRTPESSARRYQGLGLAVPPERVITSGSLLPAHFRREGLEGKACVVLGTGDSIRTVAEAGGRILPAADDADLEVLVVCDEQGYPFRGTLDRVVTCLFRRLDRGQEVRLILANPDIIYPEGAERYGLTAGGIAGFLEAALSVRYPGRKPGFERLGKPHSPMFEEAERRAGTRTLVMVGDQLATDIRGARQFGIDSALVLSGLTQSGTEVVPEEAPTFVLEDLR